MSTALSREQKEAVGLLSIGTFLEYFDLMLYVHMAVLLNELFFPKTDPHTAALLSAFAFCSTFVFRPFGALLFGYIGDNIGRKHTVIITTFMMSTSCIIMANLPTYAEIGISAAWILTACRVLQGMSSMGEIIGAKLYLTETIQPPTQYTVVTLMSVFVALGTMSALGVASITTMMNFNWRAAFWVGAAVALIGAIARTRLRETPDFVNAKKRVLSALDKIKKNEAILEKNPIWSEPVNSKTSLSYFFIECGWPVCIYFTYIYCASILKNSFNYTSIQIIHHNFIISLIDLFALGFLVYLSSRVYPMLVVRVRLIIFSIFILFLPYLLNRVTSVNEMFMIQSFIIFFAPGSAPATSIFLKYFPIFKRFTYTSVLYALSRALMYVITSFGAVYLTEKFGHWGISIIMIPLSLSFMYGLHHFEKLERANIDPEKNYSH